MRVEKKNIKSVAEDTFQKIKASKNDGQLASYIPELNNVNPENFGVFIATINNQEFGVGDCHKKFSIQSISKVLSLTLAYQILDEEIWKRVGVEPSGNKFNSLIQLEADNGIPRNPFINAGAIVISDILVSCLKKPKEEFLAFVRTLSGNKKLNYSYHIAESEKSVGYRNIALCNYLKALGNIENHPDQVLDFYFTLCSLEMTCEELSKTFLFLCNDGKTVFNNTSIVSNSQSKRINALMLTCGFYDESGEFAFKVGIPGKSGVGGGIVSIHPDKYAIAVWSPKLNQKGNSYRGMRFLEEFTTQSDLSIF